mmetsp:Transcript_8639/g.19730  ORF Transcript_8639/g.19730 Transcript_8639/m.19730 type:complete len:267 (+) Transcript_8639:55-855(+)|eukprot:CAMPEP_0197893866 /NCGR_PEP_ID=MMETSP1439-20131203/33657_1 /TAXON_ID=66791 /ORGANISM="Gonyaulax spinifera, Strain CCMP409" /LENGTH=266 /DNA_ID=CAMNT_0043514165 /DNA_START=55 /DNA_END=855 /DNA_ORIENTATION=-
MAVFRLIAAAGLGGVLVAAADGVPNEAALKDAFGDKLDGSLKNKTSKNGTKAFIARNTGAVERALKCKKITTCSDCLAEGSGCYGWYGTECCAKEACLMIPDRTFYKSCAEYEKTQKLMKVCEKVPSSDACACIKAGCTAQEMALGITSCFASPQLAGGRVVRESECSDKKDEKHPSEASEEKSDDDDHHLPTPAEEPPMSSEQLDKIKPPAMVEETDDGLRRKPSEAEDEEEVPGSDDHMPTEAEEPARSSSDFEKDGDKEELHQ